MDGQSNVDGEENADMAGEHGQNESPTTNHDFTTPPLSHSPAISIQDNDTPREFEDGSLRDENVSLRRRLAESGLGFQERLDQQTNLISKLQDKLKDSQRRISDMDAAERSAAMNSMSITSPIRSSTPRKPATTEADDLMLTRLLEEQDRISTLNEINATLKRELDETKSISVNLTTDLLRVSEEYQRTKRELQSRMEEYKRTEKLYLERLSVEHRQMLNLWRSFQQLRRDYADCRSLTRRGLSSMESELQRVWKGTAAACQKLGMWQMFSASMRAVNDSSDLTDVASSSVMIMENSGVEEMIVENVRRLTVNQNEKEETIRQMQQRLDELAEQKQLLESQLLERDRQLEAVRNEGAKAKESKEESYVDYLHNALRDLADQVLTQDVMNPNAASSMISPRRRSRSYSPGGLKGRAAAETTVRLVKEALDRRQREASELSTRLRTIQQRLSEAEKAPSIPSVDTDRLEKDLNDVSTRAIGLMKERDDALREKENLKAQIAYLKNDVLPSEKKKREAIEGQLEKSNRTLEEAHKRILQLESAASNLEDERDRHAEENLRLKADIVKWKSSLDAVQSSLITARDEAADYHSINNRLERENNESSMEVESAKEELKKLEAKCAQLTKDLEQSRSNEQAIHDRYAALDQERIALIRERDEVQQECRALEKRLEHMETEFMQMDTRKESVESEVKMLTDELDALRQMEIVWNQERTLLITQLEAREADLHDFEKHFGALKKEHAQTEAQFKLALTKQRELETQLDACRRDLTSEHEKSTNVFEERQNLIDERFELEQQAASLTEQIHRLESHERQSEEKFRMQLLELERRVAEADEQKKVSETLILDLNRRLDDAYEEKRNAESRTSSLQAVVMSQQEVIGVNETEKRNAQSRIAQLEVQLRGREAQLKQISEKFENLNAELDKMKTEKRNLKAEFDRIFEERQSFRSDVVNLTADVQRLRSQLHEATIGTETANDRVHSLTDQLKMEEHQRKKLESELDVAKSSLALAESWERELQIQLDNAQSLISEHASEAERLRDQSLNAQQELRTSEQEKRMIEERYRDAKEQLSKIKKEFKESADEKGKLESKVTDLEHQLTSTDSQSKSIQKMLSISQETEADLKRQLENVVSKRRHSQSRFNDLEKKLETLEAEKRELESTKAQLEREVAKLNKDLTRHWDELQKDEKALAAAAREREANNKSLSAMEVKNSQLDNIVKQLHAQLTKIEQDRAQRLAEQQRQRAEYEDEINDLRDQIHNLNQTIEADKRRLKLQDDEIKRLLDVQQRLCKEHQDLVQNASQKDREIAQLRMSYSYTINDVSQLTSPPGSPSKASTPVKHVMSRSATGSSTNSFMGKHSMRQQKGKDSES